MEAIGRNSNLGHLCKRWAALRERINELPARPPSSPDDSLKPRLKRSLAAEDITDIVRHYEAGETTQQIGVYYGISKKQISEAATLYATGRSLAWLGAHFDVSHTTVGTALRRRGVRLRTRPGWMAWALNDRPSGRVRRVHEIQGRLSRDAQTRALSPDRSGPRSRQRAASRVRVWLGETGVIRSDPFYRVRRLADAR